MESLLNYALTYAQVNCKVFPLKVNSKDGQTLTSLKEKATTDKKQITKDDVFVVWSCKTLQNNKALLSTNISDGMYYECTYNGDKNELYFDAYKKWENRRIKLGG